MTAAVYALVYMTLCRDTTGVSLPRAKSFMAGPEVEKSSTVGVMVKRNVSQQE